MTKNETAAELLDRVAREYRQQKDELEKGYADDLPPNSRTSGTQQRRRRFKPWTYDELKNTPKRPWRVGSHKAPLLIDKGLWATFGEWKSAKTFFKLEQEFCIAHGLDFLGQPTIQGNVAYVIAEGGKESAFDRVRALCDKHNIDERECFESGRFNLITSGVDLANPTRSDIGLNELLADLRPVKPVVVVLDTWMRMLQVSGGHSADPKIVAQALRGCDRIREELDCAVDVVAHVGLREQWRMAGMADFEGVIDGATRCEKTGSGPSAIFTFQSVFQRHAEEGFTLRASLRPFEETAYLVGISERDTKANNLNPEHKKCFDILLELLKRNSPDEIDGVPVGAWRDAVKAAGLWSDDTPETWRKKWSRSKQAIEEAGLIDIMNDGNQVYLRF